MEGVQHSGPTKMVLYFTGATNILYTFGGHAVTVYVFLFNTHLSVYLSNFLNDDLYLLLEVHAPGCKICIYIKSYWLLLSSYYVIVKNKSMATLFAVIDETYKKKKCMNFEPTC